MMRLTAAVLLIIVAPAAEARAGEGYRRYQIESGIVEYALSGSETGTQTLYFEDWGRREAKYSNAEVHAWGTVRKQSTLTLIDGESTYYIDLDAKTARKTPNTLYRELAEGEGEAPRYIGEEVMRRKGGKKIGTERIDDRPCDIWEQEALGTKTWIWKGIPIRTETHMMGLEMTTVATRIEENAKIREEKFRLPAGITITAGGSIGGVFQKPGSQGGE